MLHIIKEAISRVLDSIDGINSSYIAKSTDMWCVEYTRRTQRTTTGTYVPMV